MTESVYSLFPPAPQRRTKHLQPETPRQQRLLRGGNTVSLQIKSFLSFSALGTGKVHSESWDFPEDASARSASVDQEDALWRTAGMFLSSSQSDTNNQTASAFADSL